MENTYPEGTPEETRPQIYQKPRVKRAPIACEYCHQRKIRCDVMHGFPCTNCRLDGIDCKKRAPKATRASPQKRTASQKAAANNTQTPESFGVLPDSLLSSDLGVTINTPPCACERPTSNSIIPQHSNPRTKPRLPFSYYAFLDGSRLGRLKESDAILLESQDCLHLPPVSVLDNLINHYFLYVHPSLPLLDESEFWRMYRNPYDYKGHFSLLLFQAMLFAAAPFVPLHIAEQCGFSSLITLRDDFYRKAKLLYGHCLEDDNLIIAQTAILLSFYNSNTDAMSNSTWLSLAIKHAQAENAHQYDYFLLVSAHDRLKLKRLWWCCIIRDRVISLGMRRPIQILPDQYPITGKCLSLEDLQDEMNNSEVYRPDIKLALGWVLIRLCEFVAAVTDLLVIVYPPPNDTMWDGSTSKGSDWEKLEQVRSRIALWEADFMSWVEHEGCHVYPSITVFVHLTSVYYQASRMAMCNHACRLAAEFESPRAKITLEYYKTELQDAVTKMTDKVKRLILADMAKYLPVSAMACTVLPLILWGMNVGLSSTPAAKRRNVQKLSLFKEINRLYSMRYDIKRVAVLVQQVLEFVKPEIMKMVVGPKKVLTTTISFSDMFEKEPQSYAGLCLYLDGLLSADDKIKEVNAQKFIRMKQLQLRQLQQHRVDESSCSSGGLTGGMQQSELGLDRLGPWEMVSFPSMLNSSGAMDSSLLSPSALLEQIDTKIAAESIEGDERPQTKIEETNEDAHPPRHLAEIFAFFGE